MLLSTLLFLDGVAFTGSAVGRCARKGPVSAATISVSSGAGVPSQLCMSSLSLGHRFVRHVNVRTHPKCVFPADSFFEKRGLG